MTQLCDVPGEITNHILGFVPRSDLLSLCLTNKFLRYSAEPFLYSTIILEWERDHIPQIIPLIRTLLQRPELFDYLDTVSMNGHIDQHMTDNRILDLDSADIPFEKCIAAIEKTKLPYRHLWIRKLKSGSTCLEALSALLLANLSRTRRLAITRSFIAGRELIGKVIQSKVFGRLPRFEQLKEIRYTKEYCFWVAARNDIFTDVISLFYLSTTEIRVWIPNPALFRWPAGQPNLDHLTSLDILELSEEHLANILALARNLKSLLWKLYFHQASNTTTLDLDTIITVLSHVKGTLEELRLRVEAGGGPYSYYFPDIPVTGSLSGLADFNRITYLEVPLMCLAGFLDKPNPLEDSVPATAMTLALSEDMLPIDARWLQSFDLPYWKEVEDLVKSLAENAPTKLPQLRRLLLFHDEDSWCFLKATNVNEIRDTYSDTFDVEYSAREAPDIRFCFGWRDIPKIDYGKQDTGPRWAK